VPVRKEDCWAAGDRWLSIHLSRVGDDGSNLVGAVFDDVTQRKKAEIALRESEERQAFLLELSDAIRPLADPVEIMTRASELTGRRFGVGRCGHAEVDGDDLIVQRDWTDGVTPSRRGTYPLERFGSFIAEDRAGRTAVVEDAHAHDEAREVEAGLKNVRRPADKPVGSPSQGRPLGRGLLLATNVSPRLDGQRSRPRGGGCRAHMGGR
jgi:PAS domain-containing protein